jgi:hypothetical protein
MLTPPDPAELPSPILQELSSLYTESLHRMRDDVPSVFHEMIILSEGFQHIKKEIHELLACIAFSGKAHGACGAAHTSNSDPRSSTMQRGLPDAGR